MVKKGKTSASEILALRAKIAELEKAAEDEIKGFVSGIREALKAAKVEAPSECTLNIVFAEPGSDFTLTYRNGSKSLKPRASGERDGRLPAPGTKMTKNHKDQAHEIVFLEDGVELDGQRFATVSAAAKFLTGTATNGYAFFGL